MKNPLWNKIKAEEARQIKPYVYFLSGVQVWALVSLSALVGGAFLNLFF